MAENNGPVQSGSYSKIVKYIQDPSSVRLSMDSSGDLRLVERVARQNLVQYFFGMPSLDQDTTLRVLLAVKRFLRKGDFGDEEDRKVVGMARTVLRSMESESTAHRQLGEAFQEAIVHFVRQNRLQRAVLIEEETIQHWEQSLSEHSLFEDLPKTHLVVLGRAARRCVQPPLQPSTAMETRHLLKALVENLDDAIEVEELEEHEDYQALIEALPGVVFEHSKTMRLLKAVDRTVLNPLQRHIGEVLSEVESVTSDPLVCTMHSGLVMIYFEPNSVVVRRTLHWTTDPELVPPTKSMSFDCSLTLVFDRLLRRCRKVDTKICAPEFGKDLDLELCGHLNERLREQFPFTY